MPISGYAHYKLEQRAQAIADYSQALRLDPADESAFFYRAQAYRDEQRWDLSLLDFYAAALLKPDDVRVMNARGILYRDQGRYELAEAEFTKSLALQPTYYPAFFGRALSRFAAGRYGGAAEDFASARRSSEATTSLAICRFGSISPMPGMDSSMSPFRGAAARSRTRAHGPAPSLPSIAASSRRRR